MTVIQFLGYSIKRMNFEQKELMGNSKTRKIKIKQTFHTKSDVQGNKANVSLEYYVDENAPVKLNIEIVGQFMFNPDEDKNHIGFEEYLKTNAVAILFPYLRQTVTALTAMSNTMQPVILPTFNITQLLYGNGEEKE